MASAQQDYIPESKLKAMFPRLERRRYEKAATKLKKRTGIEIHWALVPILRRFHLNCKSVNRGLSVEESEKFVRLPEHVLLNMVGGGLMETEQAWIQHKGTRIIYESKPEPITIYKIAEKVEKVLSSHFNLEMTRIETTEEQCNKPT